MHFFGRISSQTVALNAAPLDLSLDAVGAIETVAVLALHWVRLHQIGAETTNEVVDCIKH